MSSSAARRKLSHRAVTAAFAALGAALFQAGDLPLPFLFGPMSACLVAALAGFPLAGLGILSTAARTILGVAVGAAITPEVVGQLPQMAASVAFMPLYIAAIALIGVPYFRKVAGYDFATAWYAAMPGGLQDMVVFGAEAGANVRALSLIHATRILMLVTIVPAIMVHGFGADLTNPIGAPARSMPASELGLMALAALVGWLGGRQLGLFGAPIIGPMIVTAALSLSGLIEHRPPAEAILSAQFLIGIGIGVGYVGVTMREIRHDILSGIAFGAILAALAAVFAEVVVQLGLAAPLEGFLSYAPGGQAEMAVLAIVAGADLGFVIVHHLTRLILVITLAPVAGGLLRRRRGQ